MNVFHSVMHFISSGQPVPPFPPGPTPTPQTGDVLFVVTAVLLAIIFIAVCFAMKQLSHGLLQSASDRKTYSRRDFAKSSSLRKMGILFIAAFALLGIAYVASNVFAFAQNAEDNIIQVVVDQEAQTVTSETSLLTNETTKTQRVYTVEVSKTDEVADIAELNDVTLKVGTQDHVLFNDKIGAGHLLTEDIVLAPGESIELSYSFEDLDFELAQQLVDKDAINIDVSFEDMVRITYAVPEGQETFGTVKLNSGGDASTSVYEEVGALSGVLNGATAEKIGTYQFVAWTESNTGQAVSTEASFIPEKPAEGWAPITYYANFSAANMAIVFKTSDIDKGVVYPSHIETDQASITYNYDTTTGNMIIGGQTIRVFPSAYCHWVSWYIGEEPAPASGTITESTVFTVNFEKDKYDLTFSSSDTSMGSVSPASLDDIDGGTTFSIAESGNITIGQNTIEVTPAQGYHFAGWTLNGQPAPSTGVIEANSAFVASFEINTYTLTFATDEHGTVGTDTLTNIPYGTTYAVQDDTSLKIGENIVRATPKDFFTFDKWCIDPSTEAITTGTISGNTKFVVCFKSDFVTYDITFDTAVGAHGTVTNEGVHTVPEGTTISITGDTVTLRLTSTTSEEFTIISQAIPESANYLCLGWNLIYDGNKINTFNDLPETPIFEDMHLQPTFQRKLVMLDFTVNDTDHCEIVGCDFMYDKWIAEVPYGGWITVEDNEVKVTDPEEEFEDISIIAKPKDDFNDAYHFDHWDISSPIPEEGMYITIETSFDATLLINQYTLTLESSENVADYVTFNYQDITVNHGWTWSIDDEFIYIKDNETAEVKYILSASLVDEAKNGFKFVNWEPKVGEALEGSFIGDYSFKAIFLRQTYPVYISTNREDVVTLSTKVINDIPFGASCDVRWSSDANAYCLMFFDPDTDEKITEVSYEASVGIQESIWLYGSTEMEIEAWNLKRILGPQNFELKVQVSVSYIDFITDFAEGNQQIVANAEFLHIEDGTHYKLYKDNKIEFTGKDGQTTVQYIQNPNLEGADINAWECVGWEINGSFIGEDKAEGIVNNFDNIKFCYEIKTFDINIVSEDELKGTVDKNIFEDVEAGSRLSFIGTGTIQLTSWDGETVLAETTATPNVDRGYEFSGWVYGKTYLFTEIIVNEPKTLTATFDYAPVGIACLAQGSGRLDTGDISCNIKPYSPYTISGDTLMIGTDDSVHLYVKAIPNKGANFTGWVVTNEEGFPQPQSGYLTEDLIFDAIFQDDPAQKPLLNLSTNDESKGKVEVLIEEVAGAYSNIDLYLEAHKYFKVDEENQLCVAKGDHNFYALAKPVLAAGVTAEFSTWQLYDFNSNTWIDISYSETDEYTLSQINRIRAVFKNNNNVKVTYKVADECWDFGNIFHGINSDAPKVKEFTEILESGETSQGATAIEDNFVCWKDEEGELVTTEKYYKAVVGADDIVLYAHFIVPKAVFDENTKTLRFYCDDSKIPANINSENIFDCTPSNFELKDGTLNETVKKYPKWFYDDGTPRVYFEHVVFDPSFKKYQALDSTSLWFTDSAIFLSEDFLRPYNSNNDNLSFFDRLFNANYIDVTNAPLDLFKPLEIYDVTGLENVYTHNITQTAFMFARRLSYVVDWNTGSYRRTDTIGKYITIVEPLTTVDLSSWTDMPYLKDLTGMFAGCNGLNKLTLPDYSSNTGTEFGSQATSMIGMFASCGSIRELDIQGRFGEKATNLDNMFALCDNLRNVKISPDSSFGINAKSFRGMFALCSQLQKLNLVNFTADSNEQVYEMFWYCTELSVLKFSDKWKVNLLSTELPEEYSYYGENRWYKDGQIASVGRNEFPYSSGPGTYIRLCPKAVFDETSKTLSFYYDHKEYEGQYFSVDAKTNLFNFLYPDWYEKELYFNGNKITLVTSNAEAIRFNNYNPQLGLFNLFGLNEQNAEPDMNINAAIDLMASLIQEVDFHTTCSIDARNVHFDDSFRYFKGLISTSAWFAADSQGYQPYKTFEGFENINTSGLVMTNSMFGGFSVDGYIDLALTTLAPLAMGGPEQWRYDYKDYLPLLMPIMQTLYSTYDISTQDTYGTSIEYLDLSNFDPDHNLRSYSGMFANCSNLKSVVLPKNILTEAWFSQTSERILPSFGCMFANCKNLETIVNLNGAYGAQTSGLASCEKMFYGCENLKSLDLTYFNTRNIIENMEGAISEDDNCNFAWDMFTGCNKLSNVIIGKDWNLPMSKSGLIDTADEGNPWINDGEAYDVKQIPGLRWNDEKYCYDPITTGEFIRDPSLIREKTIYINPWLQFDEDPLDKGGTVSVDKINYTGTITYSLNNYRFIINGQQVSATPDEGLSFKYWAISNSPDEIGYKVTTSFLADYLKTLSDKEVYLHAVFGDPNLKAKAIYWKQPDPETNVPTETLSFVFNDIDYSNNPDVEKVYDIEPNTYMNPSFYLFTPFYIRAFSGMCIPAQLPPWFELKFVNAGSLLYEDYYSSENSRILPLWDRWNDRDILPQIKWSIAPKNVIFEETFSYYEELQSISMWFMADQFGNQSIEKFYSKFEDGTYESGFANLNTSGLTNVAYAFGGMFYPYGFDISRNMPFASETAFDVIASVAYAAASSYALPGESYNRTLKYLDLSNFDFSNLKSLAYLCANNVGLQKIIFPEDIDTSKVLNMDGVFANCENLGRNAPIEDDPIENLEKFNTNRVESFNGTFYGCSNIKKLDFSGWKTESAYDLDIMSGDPKGFYNVCQDMLVDCNRLQEISITSSCAYVEELMPFNLHGWTFNLDWDCGLEDFGAPWYKKGTSTPQYWSYQIPTEMYYPMFDYQVVSGTFTREAPSEHSIKFEVDDEDHGTINGEASVNYNFISSAAVKLNSDNASQMWSDNTIYEATPKEGYRFKYWAYGTGFDASLQGQRVPEGQTWNWESGEDYSFVAVFESSQLTAKAVFRVVNNVGSVTYVYNTENYVVGQDNVVFVGTVEPNFDDYNLPSWYVPTSESWHVGDNHRIPKFNTAIEQACSTYKIIFDSSFANYDELVSMSCWFMPAISNVDESTLYSPFLFDSTNFVGLENINTKYISNVAFMFGGHEFFNDYAGSHTEEVNLTGFDNGHNLKNLNGLFANCKDLTTITWTDYLNQNIVSLNRTFYNCRKLVGEDGLLFKEMLAWLDTTNVVDMSYCFAWYRDDTPKEEELIDVLMYDFPDTWTTANVTNMSGMFSGIKEVKQIHISSQYFNTQNVTDMSSMFASDYNLKDAHTMLEGAQGWNTSSVQNMAYMFADCNKLQDFDFKLSDPSDPSAPKFYFHNVKDINHMFECCYEMTKFTGNSDYRASLADARYSFADCNKLEYADLSIFNVSGYLLPSFNYAFTNMFILHDENHNVINNNVLNELLPFGFYEGESYLFAYSDIGLSSYNVDGSQRAWCFKEYDGTGNYYMRLPSEATFNWSYTYCTCKHQIKFETNLPTSEEAYILSSREGPAGISYSEDIVADINIEITKSGNLQTSEVWYQMQGNNYYLGFYDQQSSTSVGGKWYLDGVELSTTGYTTINKTTDHVLYYQSPDYSVNSMQVADDAINPVDSINADDAINPVDALNLEEVADAALWTLPCLFFGDLWFALENLGSALLLLIN